jgi:hypothetical protein
MRHRLSEESRFELTLGAATRERRNRPMAALVLSGVVLVASAVFAIYAVGARATTRAMLTRSLEDQAQAEVKIAQWIKLTASEGQTPAGSGKPTEFRASRMEDLATRAGMKNRPNAPASPEDKSRPGIVVYKHIYTGVQDPSLAALVEWVRLATEEISGLELESLKVRPEPAGWRMDVSFRRWERAGT